MILWRNKVFRIIVLMLTMTLTNLSVHDSLRFSSDDDSSTALNELESIIELVLEVGLDLCYDNPKNTTSETDDTKVKINLFDCSFCHGPEIPAVLYTAIPPPSGYYNMNFREFIREIVPPPPKA